MKPRPTLLVAALLAANLFVSVAFGQDAAESNTVDDAPGADATEKPDEEADSEASTHPADIAVRYHELAQEQFAREEYARAADSFQRAYDAVPHPTFLKNIFVARYRAGDCEGALEAGSSFLAESSRVFDSDRRDIARARADCAIERARSHLDAGRLEEAAQAVEEAARADRHGNFLADIERVRSRIDRAVSETLASGAETDEPEANGSSVTAKPAPSTQVTHDPAGGGTSWLTPVGWTLVGAGTATLVTQSIISLFIYPMAVEDSNALVEGCRSGACDWNKDDRSRFEALENDLDFYRTTSLPMWVGGSILTAAGATMLFIAPAFEGERVRVGASPSSVDVIVTWD